jgi:hypothetical protein
VVYKKHATAKGCHSLWTLRIILIVDANSTHLPYVVAATGRLSINRKGTGTCPDDPVFRHRELTVLCVP